MSLNVRAVQALMQRLQQISIATGYVTDLGGRVLWGRRQLEPDQIPALIVFEGAETATNSQGGAADGTTDSMRVTLELNVEAWLNATPTAEGAGMGAAKADIKRAVLRYEAPALADNEGVIGKLTYLGAEPVLRADGTTVEGVVVRFSVALVEGYGNPDGPR